VAQTAASLPVSMRISGRVLKHGLRLLAARYLPASIAERPSRRFGLSPSPWMTIPVARPRSDSLRTLFGDVLGSAPARQRGYFNQAVVDRMLREHLSGVRDHVQLLWTLVVLEMWERSVTGTASGLQTSVSGSSQLPVMG